MSMTRTGILTLGVLAGMLRGAYAGPVEAVTRPSEDVTLSFVRPGQVVEVLVKEGDSVQEGQTLVRQDDAVESAELAGLKAQADDTVHMRGAEARLAQKRVDLEKLEQARARGGAVSEWDVSHARLDVTIEELTLGLAQFKHEQDIREYEKARLVLERMQLKSPIAGVVEKLGVKRGEAVEGLQKVIRVVKIHPLWVDVPALSTDAARVKLDAPTTVRFPDGSLATGKVIHVGAVVDAASDTRLVRVEVANESTRPAGERVTVDLGVR